MNKVELNELAREIHAQAVEKGFWDVEDAMLKHIAKMHSELSEALQEDRMGHPMLYVDDIDALDRITDPEMFDGRKPEGVAAELADFVMMALDLTEQYGIDIGIQFENERQSQRNMLREMSEKAGLHILIYAMHNGLALITCSHDSDMSEIYESIVLVELWLEQRGVDLWQVIRLKLTYNKSRPALHGRKY